MATFYAQAGTPGTPAAGDIWINTTTGDFKVRDTSNANWNTIFNINLVNGGLLPKAGGAMTGAITGAHGLAPLDSAPLTTNVTLDGNDLASKNWVNSQLTNYQLKGA